jgi:prophage antirepressor-like protein
MPSLKGYQVQTHPLPDDRERHLPGGREIDILHAPDDVQHLWTPAIQVAELTDDGYRSEGHRSTSDVGRHIDRPYQRREPDPNKLYSRTRVLSTTLFAVEGLIQKTFHTKNPYYVNFCYVFLSHVLPGYPVYAAHHAELIMCWYEALENFNFLGGGMDETWFRAARKVRDARWVNDQYAAPTLVLTTIGHDQVVCTGEPPAQLRAVPLTDGQEPLTFEVARIRDVHTLLVQRHKEHKDWPRLVPWLAMRRPDGSLTMTDQVVVVPPRPVASPEPAPEPEIPGERPLPGVPALFEEHQCPVYGSYEDPSWIGLYVCDVLSIVNPHQALSRIPAEEKGVLVVDTPGGPQSHVTLKEAGLYRLISTSHKPEAEKFKNWLYREVLPSIRKYGHYQVPGAKPITTADDVRQALLAFMRQELPGVVRPIIQKVVRAHIEHGELADAVRSMTEVAAQLVDVALINREQLELSRQAIELIIPNHEMFLPASDYIEMDGVAEALKRAPKLAEPSFGLDHCPDFGKASLWMKRLCRDENKKVAANAVARIIAKDAGLEIPPLYIPEFRMKRLEREHAKKLCYNPACWARLKQKFLPIDTPTLLFPGPRSKPVPETDTKTEEA